MLPEGRSLTSSARSGSWITASTSSRSIRLVEGLAKVPDNVSLLLRKALVQLHLNQTESGRRDPAALAPETSRTSGWFDLDDAARSGYRGCPGGRRPVSAGSVGPRPEDRAQLASLASFLGSALGQAGYPAAAIKHLELAARLSSDEEKQVVLAASESAGQPGDLGLGEEPLSSLAGARSTLRRPFANRSSRRWAGPRKGSGRRRPRPSSCWPRVRRRA